MEKQWDCNQNYLAKFFLFRILEVDLSFVVSVDMGLEQKLNKWLIGAVMGKKHVIEHELFQESVSETKEKKWNNGLKGFLELWVDELKHNVGDITKSVPSPKGIFWRKKKEEADEDESW